MAIFLNSNAPYYVGTNDSVTINLSSEETVKLNKNFTLNSDKYISQITSSVSNLFNSLSTDTVENVQIETVKNSTDIKTADDINFLNSSGEVVDHYDLVFDSYSTYTGLHSATLNWGIDYQDYYKGYITYFTRNGSQITSLFFTEIGGSGTQYTQPVTIFSAFPNQPAEANFAAVFNIFLSTNMINKSIPITITYTV